MAPFPLEELPEEGDDSGILFLDRDLLWGRPRGGCCRNGSLARGEAEAGEGLPPAPGGFIEDGTVDLRVHESVFIFIVVAVGSDRSVILVVGGGEGEEI